MYLNTRKTRFLVIFLILLKRYFTNDIAISIIIYKHLSLKVYQKRIYLLLSNFIYKFYIKVLSSSLIDLTNHELLITYSF